MTDSFRTETERVSKRLVALFQAVKNGDLEAVRELSNAEPELLQATLSGYTVLRYAIWQNRREIAKWLIEEKELEVDVHAACCLNLPERLDDLLNQSPQLLHETTPDGWRLANQAASFGYVSILQVLLRHGADFDFKPNNAYGHRPVHSAILFGQYEAAEFLLTHKANPSLANNYGQTPLHLLTGKPPQEALRFARLLLSFKPDLQIAAQDGYTPLQAARLHDQPELAVLLSEQGAKVQGRRPLCRPPQGVCEFTEAVLNKDWSGPVKLGACTRLRGDRVLRFVVRKAPHEPAPISVIVKRAKDAEAHAASGTIEDCGLYDDWAAHYFLEATRQVQRVAPRIYGGNTHVGLMVTEDLGDRNTLVDVLMGQSANKAEEALLALARALARMHAGSLGRADYLKELRQSLGHPGARMGPVWQALSTALPSTLAALQALDCTPAKGFQQEFIELARAIENPEHLNGFIHGDLCPANVRLSPEGAKLFDFEAAGFGHLLLDVAFARLSFPTSWCVNVLPLNIVEKIEETWRVEMLPFCDVLEDRAYFQKELMHACGFWTLVGEILAVCDYLDKDTRWGIASMRQRILYRVQQFVFATANEPSYPAVYETFRGVLERLKNRWPNTADLPFYPAFRREYESAR